MASRRQGSTLATGSGSAAPAWPATTLAGSLLVARVAVRDASSNPSISAPAGWSLAVGSTPQGGDAGPRIAIYYILDAAARSSTETFTATGELVGAWLEEWEPGAGETITLDEVASTFTAAGGTTDRPTGTTATTSGETIQAGAVAVRNATRTLSSIQDSFTERINGIAGSGFSGMTMAGGDKIEAAAEAAATGWTVNNASGSGGGGAIATFLVEAGGAEEVAPASFAVSAAFGSPAVVPGAVAVAPAGFALSATFGTPEVSAGQTVSPAGFAVGAAFGEPTVAPGAVAVAPAGFAVAAAFGEPVVQEAGGAVGAVRRRLLLGFG